VCGKDVVALLSRITVRDLERRDMNRRRYLCRYDDDGKVLDVGTVMRLVGDRFRVTAAGPAGAWRSAIPVLDGRRKQVRPSTPNGAPRLTEGPRGLLWALSEKSS
jgi:hypothetical protein